MFLNRETYVFEEFLKTLKDNGYSVDYKVVYCPDYGIPQIMIKRIDTRRRTSCNKCNNKVFIFN